MIYILYGSLGFLVVLIVMAAGALAGWKLRALYEKNARQVVEDTRTEEEKRKFEEDQKAFDDLMGYNIRMAYGENKSVTSLLREAGFE